MLSALRATLASALVGPVALVGLVGPVMLVGLAACGGGGAGGAGNAGNTGAGNAGNTGAGNAGNAGGSPAVISCDGEPTLHVGEATYYDFADGSGACGFAPSPDDLRVAAINAPQWAGSAMCGACARVTGPEGELVVRIVDLCPECAEGDLDLSPSAFESIAPLEAGRVDVSWHVVPCEVTGNVVYHFKEGSNPWWMAIQVRNHSNPVAEVLADKGGELVPLVRSDYNFFLDEAGLGEGPYHLVVRDVLGQELSDLAVPFVEAGEVPGGGQFPVCGE